MKHYNFAFPLLGLDGQPLLTEEQKPIFADRFLAGFVAKQTQGDAYKLFGMAIQLYRGETIILDKSDAKLLRDIIEKDHGITVLVKAQLFEELDETRVKDIPDSKN